MIKIHVSLLGNTYITRGTCRLFIDRNSPRRECSDFMYFLDSSMLVDPGSAELYENRWSINSFENLKRVINDLYYGHIVGSRPVGVYDSVNVITLDCIAVAQDIVRRSVFA